MESARSNDSDEQPHESQDKYSEGLGFDYDETIFEEFTNKYKQSLKAISSIEEMSELRKKFNKINHSYIPVCLHLLLWRD